jgi:hypothetical protein
LGRPLINQGLLLEGVVLVFYAGEEVLDIGCKSEILWKETFLNRNIRRLEYTAAAPQVGCHSNCDPALS